MYACRQLVFCGPGRAKVTTRPVELPSPVPERRPNGTGVPVLRWLRDGTSILGPGKRRKNGNSYLFWYRSRPECGTGRNEAFPFRLPFQEILPERDETELGPL
jgi:hypothetical protein